MEILGMLSFDGLVTLAEPFKNKTNICIQKIRVKGCETNLKIAANRTVSRRATYYWIGERN